MISINHYSCGEWPTIAGTWSELVSRSSEASFFMTAGWVETWLEVFGESLRPRFVVFRDRDRAVGACALVHASVRKGPFTLRRLYLNTSGEDDADSPCLEFNTLLCEPGYEAAVAEALRAEVEHLRRTDPWDELVADGIVEGTALAAIRHELAGCVECDQVKPAFYVDLEQVRRTGKPYVDGLGAQVRAHVRRSARKLAERGEVRVEQAASVAQAQRFLDELIVLHQRTWTERGFPGSFASAAFERFHRKLIERCHGAGEIQLLRVRAGHTTIGTLYNFVFRNKAYFYQCGYDYSLGSRFSPGMVSQAMAIQWAADGGLAEYDLMAGDVDYKRKLASLQRTLHWQAWQAPSVKMKAFELLRGTKRKLGRYIAERSA